MSTFTNGYRNTIKIEMNRSDKNRFKHFNFLVKFDLHFRVAFQNLTSNLTSSFLNLALANFDKFVSRAKFGKLFKFDAFAASNLSFLFLNFKNLTVEFFVNFINYENLPSQISFQKCKNDVTVATTTSLSFKLHFKVIQNATP